MLIFKTTQLEECRVASFHVSNSLAPEDEVFALFGAWAEKNSLFETYRFIPTLGFNHPFGEIGQKRGYELWVFIDRIHEADLSGLTIKTFRGGLFAVTTIPGLDLIPEYSRRLREAVDAHPLYETDYPADYRHGIDPCPEYEMVYTPNATREQDFILDYFIPIRRRV